MPENDLMSFSSTAKAYGVYIQTISDLVKKHGLTPKPMSNGKCKGLDRKDRRIIRQALGMTAAATA